MEIILRAIPVKIIQAETNSTSVVLNNVTSGQERGEAIKFSIVDHDNQVSAISSGGRITISPLTSGAAMLGTSSASLVNGIATFNDLILVAQPGSKNIKYRISSTSIDESKLLRQYGKFFL